MPGHFDMLGQVSYFTDVTVARWFLMPGMALGTAVMMYGISALMARAPDTMNVPDPKTYAKLTPDRQATVIQLMQDVMYGITALLLLVFTMVQLGTYSVTLNEAYLLPIYTRVLLWGSLPLLILLGPVVVWLLHDTIQRLHTEQVG